MKEVTPNFLLHDGSFFISASFTPECYQNHYSKGGKAIFSLEDYMVKIEKWSIELAQVDSSVVFSSYASLQMQFIIHEFKVISDTKVQISQDAKPKNLFRDDLVRINISQFLVNLQNECLRKQINSEGYASAVSLKLLSDVQDVKVKPGKNLAIYQID